MSDSITASPRHPNATFDTITQVGLKAHALATQHQASVGPRLTTGLLDALASDLTKLGVVVPSAKQVRAEVRVFTVAHAAATSKGFTLLRAARNAARKRAATPDVKKAYGVGSAVHENAPDEVTAALKGIIDRAKANAEEAAALGILAKDVAAMEEAHAEITGVGTTQSQKRATAPLTTQERNQTANRILKAVAEINTAGAIEFAADPAMRAAFEALTPPPLKRKPAKKEAAKKGPAKEEVKKETESGPATLRDTTPPVEPTPPTT